MTTHPAQTAEAGIAGATTQVETALAEDTGASETVAATAEETAERRSQVD